MSEAAVHAFKERFTYILKNYCQEVAKEDVLERSTKLPKSVRQIVDNIPSQVGLWMEEAVSMKEAAMRSEKLGIGRAYFSGMTSGPYGEEGCSRNIMFLPANFAGNLTT